MSGDEEAKWATRLERERKARRQAESIAERGMRELWLANQTLEEKVAQRTVELDRSIAALEQAGRTRQQLVRQLGHALATPLATISGHLELLNEHGLGPEDCDRVTQARAGVVKLDGALQALLALSGFGEDANPEHVESRVPADVLDEFVERWQRPAARHSQFLMGALESANEEPVLLDWPNLVVAIDAMLDACVQFASTGPLDVIMTVSEEEVSVVVEDSGPELPVGIHASGEPSALVWAGLGRRGVGLAVAQQMADHDRARFVATAGERGGIRAEFSLRRVEV